MPLIAQSDLPSFKQLQQERKIRPHELSLHQHNLPRLRIGLLNLMHNKEETELNFMRILDKSPYEIELTLLIPKTHTPKTTAPEHIAKFYATWETVEKIQFDGFIITGAPVEMYPYEEVNYWEELCRIMAWCDRNVKSTMYSCWGSLAGLYYHHGITKYKLPKKLYGVFPHQVVAPASKLMTGIENTIYLPHSRVHEIHEEDVIAAEGVNLLLHSDEANFCMAESPDGRRVFILGHPEYPPEQLKAEYIRDSNPENHKNNPFDLGNHLAGVPYRYFENDDPTGDIIYNWGITAEQIYQNWIANYVSNRSALY